MIKEAENNEKRKVISFLFIVKYPVIRLLKVSFVYREDIS